MPWIAAVHTVLNDLLPPASYYRFNPYMSEEFSLDETRNDKWAQMQLDTRMYCRKNQHKLENLAFSLSKTRLPHQKAYDVLKARLMS